MRSGLLYRSTELSRIDEADRARLASLGIRTVVDLRTDAERARWPEEANLPEGAAYVVADVLADAPDGTPAQFMPLMNDPEALRGLLGGGKGIALFERHYRDFVRLPSARAAYRRLFETLLDPARRPLVFHCTTGKDRTGWAAAALQLLLGVPEETVVAEYLRSNGELGPLIEPLLAEFRARGGDPELLTPMAGVRRSYLEAALDEVGRRYGSIENYFRVGLGFDDAALEALRAALVEPS
jgi:protein-tyrosine phosphatase